MHLVTGYRDLQSVISDGFEFACRSGTYQGRNSPNSVVSSVAGSAIPTIKATHAALVWNSVKTSKSEIKEFTIRNMSNNKIKIQIDIWDDSKSFKVLHCHIIWKKKKSCSRYKCVSRLQFLGDRQTMNTSMVLAMQRTESKTLAVMFNPYRVGPVAGKITIKHYAPTKEGRESQYRMVRTHSVSSVFMYPLQPVLRIVSILIDRYPCMDTAAVAN